jgi:hypothetical protein
MEEEVLEGPANVTLKGGNDWQTKSLLIESSWAGNGSLG